MSSHDSQTGSVAVVDDVVLLVVDEDVLLVVEDEVELVE